MRYFNKNISGNQCEFSFELDPYNYTVGSTWEDYLNGYWVPMSETQIAFGENNPSASIKEIFDMELIVIAEPVLTIEEKNNMIRLKRQMLYKNESDSLYMSYVKYTELGELEKASAAKTEWLAKVQEIDIKFPYIK